MSTPPRLASLPEFAQDVDDEVSRYFRALGFRVTWDFHFRSGNRWYEILVEDERVAQIDFGVPLARLIKDMIHWAKDMSTMDPPDYDICVSEQMKPKFQKILDAVVEKEKSNKAKKKGEKDTQKT